MDPACLGFQFLGSRVSLGTMGGGGLDIWTHNTAIDYSHSFMSVKGKDEVVSESLPGHGGCQLLLTQADNTVCEGSTCADPPTLVPCLYLAHSRRSVSMEWRKHFLLSAASTLIGSVVVGKFAGRGFFVIGCIDHLARALDSPSPRMSFQGSCSSCEGQVHSEFL